MLQRFLLKLLNLPVAMSVRFSPSLNRLRLRLSGARLGRGVCVLGRPYIAVGGGKLSIGDHFYMTNGDGVNPLCGGDRGAIYAEPGASIAIGSHVGMSSTRLWIARSLTIGRNVSIGAGVLIIDTDCHPKDFRLRRHDAPARFSAQELHEATAAAPIVIEDDVWIGAGATVLKGVTIGARTIVGAGSVVTRSLPPDSIAAGNPCRVIRKRD